MLNVRYFSDIVFNESVIKFKPAIYDDKGSGGGEAERPKAQEEKLRRNPNCRCIVWERFVMLLPSQSERF